MIDSLYHQPGTAEIYRARRCGSAPALNVEKQCLGSSSPCITLPLVASCLVGNRLV